MVVTGIKCKRFELPLKKPIKVATGSIEAGDTVIVRLETDEGIYGIGEGSGVPFVTGEDSEDVYAGVEKLAQAVIGRSPYEIRAIHGAMDAVYSHHTAAKAALDIALYDIMAKAAGLPLYRFLGGRDPVVETDKTISLAPPQEMARETAQLVRQGFRHIKIKAGEDPEADMEAARLIREAAGPGAHLKIDANQGWSLPTAQGMLRRLSPLEIQAIEQPLPAWDMDGMARLRQQGEIAIMADESCFSPEDAMGLILKGAADMINIKLMKTGGIFKAGIISSIAASAGIRCMLGCMTESRIGIAAAASLKSADPNICWADLDSPMFFEDSGEIRGGCTFHGPYIRLSEEPGLGADVDL